MLKYLTNLNHAHQLHDGVNEIKQHNLHRYDVFRCIKVLYNTVQYHMILYNTIYHNIIQSVT